MSDNFEQNFEDDDDFQETNINTEIVSTNINEYHHPKSKYYRKI